MYGNFPAYEPRRILIAITKYHTIYGALTADTIMAYVYDGCMYV